MKQNHSIVTARVTALQRKKLELIAFNNDTTLSKTIKAIIENIPQDARI